MKKVLYIIISFFLTIVPLRAQNKIDAELCKLVDIVKMMRNGDNTFNKAVNLLVADTKWTQMDETNIQNPSLRKWDSKMFGLNKAMNTVDEKRKIVYTPGDMRSGTDSRYNYSLYEHVLVAKSSITFTLENRVGTQTLVIVPYVGKGSGITASVQNAKTTGTASTDGIIILTCQTNKYGVVRITIKNSSEKSQSFVLLNHNSRK